MIMIPPSERLTPWKDMATQLAHAGQLSNHDFSRLGVHKIAYLKVIAVTDELTLIQIFAADGQMIFETSDLEKALDWIMASDLIPVPLH